MAALNDLDENTIITMNNFPSSAILLDVFHNRDKNSILTLIKNRFFQARQRSERSIRILPGDYERYTPELVNEIKEFLMMKGYTVINIEDPVGANQGFRVSL